MAFFSANKSMSMSDNLAMTTTSPTTTPTFSPSQNNDTTSKSSHSSAWKNRKRFAKNIRSVSFFNRSKKNSNRSSSHLADGIFHRNSIDSSHVYDTKTNTLKNVDSCLKQQSSLKQIKTKSKKNIFSLTDSSSFTIPAARQLNTSANSKNTRKYGKFVILKIIQILSK